MRRWLRVALVHPSAVLLGVQLVSVVVYPFLEDTSAGNTGVSIVGLLVLALATWTVRRTPALNVVSLIFGIPAVALTIWQAVDPANLDVALWSNVTHSAFYFYTAYGLIAYMFADAWVTRDELFATGACFTVVAWAFAYLYSALQIIWPGSFAGAESSQLTWMQVLFLSFTTMTNTGLSDVTPATAHARSFIMLEQLAGLNYVALVVARLLGLTIARFNR